MEDTTSTLKFASRAKSIKNKPAVNEVREGEGRREGAENVDNFDFTRFAKL